VDNDYQQLPMDDLDYHGQTHHPHFAGHHKKSKKALYIILGIIGGLVLLGAGGVAAWVLTKKSDSDKPTSNQQQTGQNSNQPSSASQQPSGVQSKGNSYTYKSTKLNIGVTYPKAWTMRESSNKEELVITSPQTTYTKKDGTSTQGVLTVKLRNGIIPDAIKTTVQNAIAVADSEVVAYTAPTGDQRQYTNLSYIGPDANSFTFALITGYTEYKAAQLVGGGVDLNGQAYMFAAGYGADSGDSLAFDPVPKADFNTATFKQAVEILESLQIY
jgi:hypothetical protein